MSSLSGSSTDAEVEAAYDDNAGYDLAGPTAAGIASARTFVHACRILLRRLPDETQKGNERVRADRIRLQNELTKAEGWLQTNDDTNTGGSTRYADFRNYRQ